ncbi:MAG TPA: short-chain dehydrogenase [Morganella sp. (in: Bacteria)]|nr:short-chain dehydrogenase [Morganella sp. (in: enterobacteria)]
MADFTGQVVLITGAGRGLGLAYAECIGRAGAKVYIQDIGADSNGKGENPDVAEHAAQLLQAKGLDIHVIAGFISSRDGCHQLVSSVLNKCGRLDAIVHNAGWVAYQPVTELTENEFDTMMAITAKAPLWLAQAAWSAMKAAHYGRIVMTTSCRALFPEYAQQGLASYAAAKMAVVGLVNTLAYEGTQHGILVNAVSPVAKTRMWGVTGEPDELYPADVAPGVAFLASDKCHSTGWILRAANGQFHATKAAEADNVNYPRDLYAVHASTLPEVAGSWNNIAVLNREPR